MSIAFARFGLRRYFNLTLSSCYMGLRKPKPEIYRRALGIIGNRPSASCSSTIGLKMPPRLRRE